MGETDRCSFESRQIIPIQISANLLLRSLHLLYIMMNNF